MNFGSRARTRALVVAGTTLVIAALFAVTQVRVDTRPRSTFSPSMIAAKPTVTSVAGLLTQLADNSVTQIVVADGTYIIPSADSGLGQKMGLWIDARFAGRTNPVLIRAETPGGVIFSGGGANHWLGLAFRDGVHDQTWQGFRFANAEPTQSGVIVFGQSGSVTPLPPYRITLLGLTIEESVVSANPPGMSGDHAVYFSRARDRGPHDIVIDGLTVHAATSGLDSAVHFYGSQPRQPNADTVTVRHLTVYGTDQAVILWDPTLRGITVSDSTISGAKVAAVRYEGGTEITLADVVSTGSGKTGFSSALGANPAGVTFSDTDLH